MRYEIGVGDFHQSLERFNGIALCAKVEGNEVGLSAWKHGHWRSHLAKMAAIAKLGKNGLHRSITAVDGEHGRADKSDRPHRLADLVDALHLIMEDVGMVGAEGTDTRQLGKVARRLGIADKCDPRPRHQLPAGPTLRPLT